MNGFSQWPRYPLPWFLLFASMVLLYVLALYFQYGMGLEPCVKCIYQRTAVIAIGLASLIGWLGRRYWVTRWFALLAWVYAAYEGLVVAYDHWDLQTSKNAFFAVCESHPNFPSWLPLHDWMPGVFGAPGLCGDIDWQFLGLGMPGWMTIIFAVLLATSVSVSIAHLVSARR